MNHQNQASLARLVHLALPPNLAKVALVVAARRLLLLLVPKDIFIRVALLYHQSGLLYIDVLEKVLRLGCNLS